ncbi:MAG: M48 family metalloprotease [Balneolales bacterium]|nr:M48 family metalloprotease [Balneolales bacterium]
MSFITTLQNSSLRKLSGFSLAPLFFIGLLIFSTGCATLDVNPVSGNRRAFAYSWEQEIQIGREVDQQIIMEYGIYDNPELETYLNALSKKILAESHMRREGQEARFRETEFTFRVLNSDVVNAFALPGGFIYYTRGLLSHMNNEAQLAVVIGHEIGHVAARHASQRAIQQQAGQLLLIGGAVAGQELLGVPAESILNIGGTAAQLLFLSYSRDHERESDRLGVEYTAKAGFDASEGAAFFRTLQRLSARAGGSLPNHLSSHPDPGDRERSMIELSQQWKERGYEQTVRNERAFMEAINGMVVGPNPREGFVRDGVFLHPELAFRYDLPTGWNVQNQARQVIMFDSNQQGVSIFSFAPNATTARQAVESFTSQEGISVESSTDVTVHGITAHRAIATGTTQQGEQIRFLVQGFIHNGQAFRFINYSLASTFDQYQAQFIGITDSFRTLTDQSVLNIQPVRIQVVTADRTGRFETFLPDEMPMGMSREEVAIMNQLELSEVVTRGQRLKIPVQQ